jgi:multicomponent K+:H+ antiporter subunit D
MSEAMVSAVGQLVALPFVLPVMVAGVLLALGDRRRARACRTLSVVSCAGLLACSGLLLGWSAGDAPAVYAMGNWPAPFGIVFVLDRLSALMLAVTAVLGLACAWYSLGGWDSRGRHFHALLQLQLAGLNGAFLTGDLFNLFVCFELLLIASYGLMLHGGGVERLRATFHYVVYNLVASSVFLIAAGLLYGMTGTLNLADLAIEVAAAPAEDAALLRSAGLLLAVVFAVKAAVLPLAFWLQGGYDSASPPVACLFAVMTKLGVYSMIRVFTVVFGANAGVASDLAQPWWLPAGIATLLFAAIAAASARSLGALAAQLVAVSAGTLLIAVGTATAQGLGAALFYLLHASLAGALLFLVCGEVVALRPGAGARLAPGPRIGEWRTGLAFLFAALAVAGLPPLSGFVAKLGVLRASLEAAGAAAAWIALLASTLVAVIALARAGSILFWRPAATRIGPIESPSTVAMSAPPGRRGAIGLLAACIALLTVAAEPVSHFTEAAARQTLDVDAYVAAVIRPPEDERSPGIVIDADRLRTHQPGATVDPRGMSL